MGRDTELAFLENFLRHGAAEARCLLLLGQVGMGKSLLLAAAERSAHTDGQLVLRARGRDQGHAQTYEVLHQLLLPVWSSVTALPERLRHAVETACGLREGPPPDPLVLRAAFYRALTTLECPREVLVVVDDLHLVDEPSRAVLAHTATQLTGTPVRLLLSATEETALAGLAADVPVLRLGPLADQDAAALLDALPDPPTGWWRTEVLRQAGGNPLALLELGEPSRSTPGGPPRHRWGSAVYRQTVRALPERTRRLLLTASAAPEVSLAAITEAAGAGLADWSPAEEAGLVSLHGDSVAFRHPLMRVAVYQDAPAKARQLAHLDLARVLAADPARQAWHRAGAVVGTDEEVAAALEHTAEAANHQDGPHTAGRALERAAELSPHPEDRARRYVRAMMMASRDGCPEWVEALHRVCPAPSPELHAVAAVVAAHALALQGHTRRAFTLVTEAVDRVMPDRDRVLALLSVAGGIAAHSGLPEHRAALTRLLARLPVGGAGTRALPDLVEPGAEAALLNQLRVAAEPQRAFALLHGDDPRGKGPVALMAAGGVAHVAEEYAHAARLWSHALRDLEARRATGQFLDVFPWLADAYVALGRWEAADRCLAHGHAVAAVAKATRVRVELTAKSAHLAALRGQAGEAAAALDGVWYLLDQEENGAARVLLTRAAASVAQARGNLGEAFEHLRTLFDGPAHPVHAKLSLAELAGLAVELDRTREIAPLVARARADAGAWPTARTNAVLHHAEALLAPGPEAEEHFAETLAGKQWPLDHARAQLDYAAWLRRRRRLVEGRTPARAALETAVRLGAAPLAERAERELRASGGAVPRKPAEPGGLTGLTGLTAQEEQVVRLAAAGLSNRAIAETMVLSPRTVASHLYNAYPKLGVNDRRQLRTLLGEG
ncbi:DNA-binding CsgD family transcriptional regulator [Crossiella equi]|uniref:DNA-binding CsgD family transcriptional regulator n=1 Tax=Crossiella equi TaxID=130796 RepID=A0ABS5ATA3_9PSEU|nr:LuxR family transcriptional regulator [Crossiella equi]MBP2478930.1 DNA-binding CsgD family transcriptional regulator [Crossiella equi]